MVLKNIVRWGLAGLLLSSATVVGINVPTLAQSYETDGLTLFGGSDAEYRLSYRLLNNEPRNKRTTWELEVRGEQLQTATSALVVTLPESFTRYRGRIDLDEITVRYGRIDREGDNIPVDEVRWDDVVFSGANDLSDDLDKIEIFLAEDIPAETSITLEFNKVKSPTRALMLRTNLQVFPRGEELATYIGTWEMLVAYEDRDS
ncbi:MAG: DUF2808 domain-containing protein [Leptolyngbya sp. SIO3F4]|nr:DUF2808 domain-containing protein [Leptolyngbya sp. SIO3F4]